MGISVRVHEYTGTVVELLQAPADVDALCAIATAEPHLYPLLSGVDPYDDTCFNPRQAAALAAELELFAERTDVESLREIARAVLRLTSLLKSAPERPHHRRLLFSGD